MTDRYVGRVIWAQFCDDYGRFSSSPGLLYGWFGPGRQVPSRPGIQDIAGADGHITHRRGAACRTILGSAFEEVKNGSAYPPFYNAAVCAARGDSFTGCRRH